LSNYIPNFIKYVLGIRSRFLKHRKANIVHPHEDAVEVKNDEERCEAVVDRIGCGNNEVISDEVPRNIKMSAFEIVLQHKAQSFESSGQGKLPLDSIREERLEEQEGSLKSGAHVSLDLSVEINADATVENKELDLKGNHISELLQDSDHHKFRNSSFELKKYNRKCLEMAQFE
jgi:hypothetical protein